MARDSSARGLSPAVIVVSGVIFAIFCVAAVFAVSHLLTIWSPSAASARKLLEKGRYDEALVSASQAHGTHAGVVVDFLLGQIWMAKAYQRNIDEEWLQYGSDPDDYFKGQDVDSAVAHFKAACVASPYTAESYLYLGTIYSEKGWFGAAETTLLDALRNDPHLVVARINLAAVYVSQGRYREAEQELLTAWKLDETSAEVAKNLSVLYRHYLEKPALAMEWSNRYLNCNPHRDPHRMLIRRDFEEMIRRYPEFAPPETSQNWRKREQSNIRTSLRPPN